MLEVLAAPSVLPVSLATAKGWLRETTADWDADILDLLKNAFEYAETISHNAIVYRPVREQFDCFTYPIELAGFPVRGVQSIKYLDTSGVWQTLDPTTYRVDVAKRVARITPEYAKFFPLPRPVTNSVIVTYDIGHVCPVTVADDVGDTLTIPGHHKAADDLVQLYTDGGTMPGGVVAAQAYYAKAPVGDVLQIAAAAGGAAVNIAVGFVAPVFLGEVPRAISQALRLILNTWTNYGADLTVKDVKEIPVHGVASLLRPLRPRAF